MRILHVTPYYEHAWAYGGIPRLAAALAQGLVRRGHDVTVATTDACDRTSRLSSGRSRSEGVDVHVFPNLSNRAAYHLQFFVPIGFEAFLHRHADRFDIAHVHACHHLPGAMAAGQLRRARVPYIVAPNGTAPRIERRRLAKYVFDTTLGRGVNEHAAAFVAVSHAEERQLQALEIESRRIHRVPNPLDLDEFDVPPEPGRFRTRLGVGRDDPLILYLGKLTPRKRLDVLIHAFARVKARTDARLVVAGNDMGVGRGLRAQIRRLGLSDSVSFTGLLHGRERLEALADASVVSYATKDEIFGLVPLEALLCHTPVIVAGDSGCGEVIEGVGGGQVVAEGDADALAAVIAAILADPQSWRERARAASVTVRRRYGQGTVCAQLEEVYRKVLREA